MNKQDERYTINTTPQQYNNDYNDTSYKKNKIEKYNTYYDTDEVRPSSYDAYGDADDFTRSNVNTRFSTPSTSSNARYSTTSTGSVEELTDYFGGQSIHRAFIEGEIPIDAWSSTSRECGCIPMGKSYMVLTNKQVWMRRVKGFICLPRSFGFKSVESNSARLRDISFISSSEPSITWHDVWMAFIIASVVFSVAFFVVFLYFLIAKSTANVLWLSVLAGIASFIGYIVYRVFKRRQNIILGVPNDTNAAFTISFRGSIVKAISRKIRQQQEIENLFP